MFDGGLQSEELQSGGLQSVRPLLEPGTNLTVQDVVLILIDFACYGELRSGGYGFGELQSVRAIWEPGTHIPVQKYRGPVNVSVVS